MDPAKKVVYKDSLEERVSELEREVKKLKGMIDSLEKTNKMLNNRTSGLVKIGGAHF